MNTKYCNGCKTVKPVSEWPKSSSRKDGLGTQCKGCAKAWRENNKESLQKYQYDYYRNNQEEQKRYSSERWYKRARDLQYGLEPGTIKDMLDIQDYKCANLRCQNEITWETSHVDHDHNCCSEVGKICGKCVRGLLCKRCNWSLGYMQDDINAILGLAEYLITLEEV